MIETLFLRLVNNKLSDITLQNLPFHFNADHISIHGSHSAAVIFMNSSKYSVFKDFLLIESLYSQGLARHALVNLVTEF